MVEMACKASASASVSWSCWLPPLPIVQWNKRTKVL
jgi:hypothetical protein